MTGDFRSQVPRVFFSLSVVPRSRDAKTFRLELFPRSRDAEVSRLSMFLESRGAFPVSRCFQWSRGRGILGSVQSRFQSHVPQGKRGGGGEEEREASIVT